MHFSVLLKPNQRVINAVMLARTFQSAERIRRGPFEITRPIKPVLKQLHWLPVSQRIDYKILLLTYKALNGQAPGYITELLKPYVPTRNLRSSSKNVLNVPPVKLVSYGQRCFSFVAPSLRNSLPDNIRQSSSLQNFKTHIKTHPFYKFYNSD